MGKKERREHYSNKGAHGARHDFWLDVRRAFRGIGEGQAKQLSNESGLTPELIYLIKQQMLRDPRDGRGR